MCSLGDRCWPVGMAGEVDIGHTDNAASGQEPKEDAVWVFGYGSLCWFPGFEYKDSILGHVTGFKRRFWQGNATHRGTAARPGRVATVVEEEKGVVWGRAFLVTGDAALPYLNQRECKLGGYATRRALFHPSQPVDASTSATDTKEDLFARGLLASLRHRDEPFQIKRARHGGPIPSPFHIASRYFHSVGDSGFSSLMNSKEENGSRTGPFPVTMYVATEDNRHWLGKAPLQSIADQIAECHGPSGSNADYLLNLAIFMRTEFPTAKDDHLFVLERLVRETLVARGERALAEAGRGREEAAASQQFTARLPSKQLRCLKI